MGVTVTRDKVGDMARAVRALTKREVLVGIPAANAARKPEDGEEGTPINNAALGYIHETGSPKQNIPARPFLLPGVEGVKDQITARLKKAGQAALSGDLSKIELALAAVGMTAQSAVQRKLVDGPFTPLKPATIAAREYAGFVGTKPLIRTGQLRQAITFVLRDKGK